MDEQPKSTESTERSVVDEMRELGQSRGAGFSRSRRCAPFARSWIAPAKRSIG
jgi:hypothetical protein